MDRFGHGTPQHSFHPDKAALRLLGSGTGVTGHGDLQDALAAILRDAPNGQRLQ